MRESPGSVADNANRDTRGGTARLFGRGAAPDTCVSSYNASIGSSANAVGRLVARKPPQSKAAADICNSAGKAEKALRVNVGRRRRSTLTEVEVT